MSHEPDGKRSVPTVDQIDFRHLAELAADPIAVHDGGLLVWGNAALVGAPRGSEPHDHQERIKEAALRARARVRQSLAFSRVDRANQRLVDVPAVVSEALDGGTT